MPHGDTEGEDTTAGGGPAEGYEVHPETLQAAGAASIQVGADVRSLAPMTESASRVQPPPAGWQIGANLLDMVPHWEKHLQAIADALHRTGSGLQESAATYTGMENRHFATFKSLH